MVIDTWMDRPSFASQLDDVDFYDVARFATTDCAEQIAAAMSCMGCLTTPTGVVLGLMGQLPVALSRCAACDAATLVELEGGQAQRLIEVGPLVP